MASNPRRTKAFEKIIAKHPLHTLTIVGDGEDLIPLQDYIRQHDLLKNKVFLKGHQSKAEIAEEMQHADFFVFPSRHESFGLVITEALSCGLPVIAGNKTAPKEYVTNECGLLVPPDDVDAIAEAMDRMINDLQNYNPELLRNQVIEKFGFEAFGKKLNAIYLKLLAG